jgi:hypothetical protein
MQAKEFTIVKFLNFSFKVLYANTIRIAKYGAKTNNKPTIPKA